MEKQEKYDGALLGILANEQKIDCFFDVVLGFLYRRTDYFKVRASSSAKLGFDEGDAESILRNAFRKYKLMAHQNETDNTKAVDNMENIDHEEEICTDHGDQEKPSAKKPVNRIENDLRAHDSYNGADYGTYKWSQSINELDIRIRVPENITKGSQVGVDINRTNLSAHFKTPNGDKEELINDRLVWKINVTESTWTLVPGEYIYVSLTKIEERWWDALLINEPKINVKEIDASRPLEDLDDDSQSKVHELLFNEHQKKLGQMTSHQMKVSNILKDAWDKDGSPFKGQPFDPSIVQIEDSGNL